MFNARLLIPGSQVHDGLKTEALESREANEDCAVIVPKINKETEPFLYMMATKASSQISVFQRRSDYREHK